MDEPGQQLPRKTPSRLAMFCHRRSLLVALGVSLLFHGFVVGAGYLNLKGRFTGPSARYIDEGGGVNTEMQAGIAVPDVPEFEKTSAQEMPQVNAPPIPDSPVVTSLKAPAMEPTDEPWQKSAGIRIPEAQAADSSEPSLIGLGQSAVASNPSGVYQPYIPKRGNPTGSAKQETPAPSGPIEAHVGVSVPARAVGRAGNGKGPKNGFDNRGLPIPDYPIESRRRGEQGVVVVDVEVLPDGKPGAIKVVTDPGFARLTEAVLAAIREANFEPATLDGKPVAGHVQIPFRFVL